MHSSYWLDSQFFIKKKTYMLLVSVGGKPGTWSSLSLYRWIDFFKVGWVTGLLMWWWLRIRLIFEPEWWTHSVWDLIQAKKLWVHTRDFSSLAFHHPSFLKVWIDLECRSVWVSREWKCLAKVLCFTLKSACQDKLVHESKKRKRSYATTWPSLDLWVIKSKITADLSSFDENDFDLDE